MERGEMITCCLTAFHLRSGTINTMILPTPLNLWHIKVMHIQEQMAYDKLLEGENTKVSRINDLTNLEKDFFSVFPSFFF